MDFLRYDNSGIILSLLDSEGISLLKKYEYLENRICYILVYSKFCHELFHNKLFLDMFLNTDIRDYYANMRNLDKDVYELLIKRAIELGKDNSFIATLFSYFNDDYKSRIIDEWPYSMDLLYEVFKRDIKVLGPKIMQKYDIDLMSHDINIEGVFETGKYLSFKSMENRNVYGTETDELEIPNSKITKAMAEKLWKENDVFKYREIINDAMYSCDPTPLNKYAKAKEEEIIYSSRGNGLIYPYSKVKEFLELDKEYELNEFLKKEDGIELEFNFWNLSQEEKMNYLHKISNSNLSNYIIDYHFEENFYNIMYDLRELLDFYFSGNINIPEERLSLYEMIAHIDELLLEDKISLHENLKKYNMMELFYDDMAFARKIVHEAIKDYSLTMSEMSKYRDEKLSEEYGIDVFEVDDEPFFAVVKSRIHPGDDLPTGHSFSLVGDGCVGTFVDPSDSTTFVYDADGLRGEQIVHVYPMDSFTMFKPFNFQEEATKRIETLMMPDELLYQSGSYNELLILEQGSKKTDIDVKIPRLRRMALYCVDKISEKDVEVAKANGVGILLVKSKDYTKDKESISRIDRRGKINYFNYNYFDYYDKDTHEAERHSK